MAVIEVHVRQVEGDGRRAIEDAERHYSSLFAGALAMAAFTTVAFLRSLTAEMRPPARTGEGSRQAHPGHWADISSHLALSYGFELLDSMGHVVREAIRSLSGARAPFNLTLSNDADYAQYLEDRHGYWVLSGVTNPGGPAEVALREAINAVEGMSA